MCEKCWVENGCYSLINVKVKKAAELISELYQTENGGAGGYGHIVFDDWNVNDVDWCLDFCKERIDRIGSDYDEETMQASIKALKYFKKLTIEERYSALALHDGFIKEGA